MSEGHSQVGLGLCGSPAHVLLGIFLAQRWVNEGGYSAFSRRGVVSGRNHSETLAGCMVSSTVVTNSAFKLSRSVSSRSLAEKASSVFLASYFLL